MAGIESESGYVQAGPRLSVLIVDDDRAILRTLALALEDEGFDVRTASNGQAALDDLRRRPADVILLDMWMPDMDGRGFAAAARDAGLELRIMAMSAATDAVDFARDVGAVAVISKPFDLDDLIERLLSYAA